MSDQVNKASEQPYSQLYNNSVHSEVKHSAPIKSSESKFEEEVKLSSHVKRREVLLTNALSKLIMLQTN